MADAERWARPLALIERWERYVPWLLTALATLLYLLTMSPSVGHTDAGELSAVAYTFGVAHPTGYPLFTLLGYLFSHLPFGSVAFRLNLMCLLMVSGGTLAWSTFLLRFFHHIRTTVKKGDSSYAIRIRVGNLMAMVGGTLFLVLGRTWWLQALGTEVYALQCLLLGLMLHALLRAWYAKERRFLRWAVFAVALALCFTNHLTAIVLLPGVAYLFFAAFGWKLSSLKPALGLVGVGLVVLVVLYGMLMVVAQSQPLYNWGNPSNWDALWHHVRGKQFSPFMFKGPGVFGENLLAYLNRLPGELGWNLIWPKIPIWIGLGAMAFQGMKYALERRREWAVFMGLTFLSNIFWAANYDIKDPEPYFIASFMVVAFLGAMVLRWCWIGYKQFAPYVTAAFFIVVGFEAVWNFSATSQRGNWQYEDYARATLESVAPDAIVLSQNWDVFIGPSYYLQGCEGLRPDVTVVDYTLLQNRHWYPAQLRQDDPALARQLAPELEAWEKAIWDFDIRGKRALGVLQPRFNAVYYGLLAQVRHRPVYIGPEMFQAIGSGEVMPPPPGLLPVPETYLVRLLPAAEAQSYRPAALPTREVRFHGDPAEYENWLLRVAIHDAWMLRANYEAAHGQSQLAADWNSRSAAVAPPPGGFKE